MMKFFKIVAVFIGCMLVLGWLLPDAPADAAAGTTSSSEAATSAATEDKQDLEILKTSETNNEFGRTVHVKVRNNTDRLIQYVDLKSVYYNKNKDIVGTGIGNAMNLAAGATKTIDIMAMGIDGATSYEVEVGNVLQ
ncbi:FxLYD domain-containing protein [Hymenobacter rubripertinctus]|uniref:DUF4352 domain-containing protein n=1 Tax=Hymenobacter rubripertinctus TaxID=2029981 RepID=A0A418QML6_9BACT|nr:FxLYD domain-containing protein [Hymenobacter rubripertinctus]RIY06477.1 hypothetical protein D0T11_18730 [Hymenobacter rubripertinctus]